MKCCADCTYRYESRTTRCPNCGSKSIVPPPSDTADRLTLVETVLRSMLKGDTEAAKMMMGVE